jgi:hypothetical protein
MKIETRPLWGKDFEIISEWSRGHRSVEQTFPIFHTPETSTFAFSANTDLAAGTLIVVSEDGGTIDFLISNPQASPEAALAGLEAVIHSLLALAADLGLRAVVQASASTGRDRALLNQLKPKFKLN